MGTPSHACLSDTNVDYEAPVVSDGSEWVDQDSVDSTESSDQETVVATSPQRHSWANVTATSPTKTGFNGDTVQHKAEVQPIFLAFHRVQSAQGRRILLFQIAAAVTEAVGPGLLDAVQPMHSGWYIYMKTLVDRQSLIQSGITVVGKHIFLRSESQQASHSAVKITLKDLPLHTITNEAVLEALKEYCLVQSEVCYSNLWHEGKPTWICNGDCFTYVVLTDILKLPDTVIVAGSVAHVFKPKSMVVCKKCGKQGHHPGDVHCPAYVPEDLVLVMSYPTCMYALRAVKLQTMGQSFSPVSITINLRNSNTMIKVSMLIFFLEKRMHSK